MSAVPVAIDALVATFSSQLEVRVVDGPPTTDVGTSVLAVGIGMQNSLDIDAPVADVGLALSRESFMVPCMARSWSGDNDIKIQRDRTYAVVNQAREVLAADYTLGWAVSRARWAGSMYMPHRTDRAQVVVDVLFRVDITQL